MHFAHANRFVSGTDLSEQPSSEDRGRERENILHALNFTFE